MAFVATSSQKVSEPKALFYDQIVNLKPADFFFAASNFLNHPFISLPNQTQKPSLS